MRSLTALTTLALGLAAALSACGTGEINGPRPTRCDEAACDDAGYRPTQGTDLVSITIDPESPTLDVSDGARPAIQFTARGRQLDGITRELTSGLVWGIDDDSLGTLDPSTGRFVPSGQAGYTHVTVALTDGSELDAETLLRVNSRAAVIATGASESDAARFEGAPTLGPEAAPSINHPLEGAVMPLNVFPPTITWTSYHLAPSPTDVFRIRLSRPSAVLEGYVLNTPGAERAWTPPADAWAAFARTDVGTPITLTVSVRSSWGVAVSVPRRFRTVDAVISGSVYYWSPPTSRLHRIDVATGTRVEFLPNPGDPCIGCHAVSRDGQRLAAYLDTSATLASYDLSRDLRGDPAPTLFRTPTGARRCVSYSADGTRLVSGDCGANPTEQALAMLDAATGTPVGATNSSVSGFDPEWSPDGEVVAFTDRGNNLATVTPVGDRFEELTTLHRASGEGTLVDWHPTWSPDANWLIFQRGGDRRTGTAPAALWMIEAAEDSEPVRLDSLNGGPNRSDSYRPVFSPFDSGEYFWVLFSTPRSPRGATAAGASNPQQIWIAAVPNEPDGASAASEVPFYLTGQDPNVTALSPYWVPLPCRARGASCGAASECCSEACAPGAPGEAPTCQTAEVCRDRGAPCGDDRDCCEGLMCVSGHICDASPG